ncbi:hypothetical protein FBEOM_13301 [Fusarium beomiforme]|uniref:Apple domain-containing protein n=1 Tax=Fusarium beomiforme TaxID=44412 RepID=A0A9P5A663_9HYPO|nr:hypothetical protein FBEOM_13301 [Fusarium beomiforme]
MVAIRSIFVLSAVASVASAGPCRPGSSLSTTETASVESTTAAPSTTLAGSTTTSADIIIETSRTETSRDTASDTTSAATTESSLTTFVTSSAETTTTEPATTTTSAAPVAVTCPSDVDQCVGTMQIQCDVALFGLVTSVIVVNLQACADLCNADNTCNAFTYNDAGKSRPPRNVLSLQLDSPFVPEISTHSPKKSFNIDGRFIYETSTGTPGTPTYHISTRNTQTGNPWQLQICRLLLSEVRRLSEATGNSGFIKYDDDLTLYSGEKMKIPFSLNPVPMVIIRGQKRGTVQESIVMEKSIRTCTFHHMIPIKRALTKTEEDKMQALMHKRGYRDSDDWKRKLPLTARGQDLGGLEWVDEYGSIVAAENDGKLEVLEDMETEKKDLIVACWACKGFVLDRTV